MGHRTFHETVANNLREKCAMLNAELDKFVHDANTEIGRLMLKLEQVTQERVEMERQCEDYKTRAKEKGKKALQFQV